MVGLPGPTCALRCSAAAGRGLLGIALAGVGFGVAIGVRDHAVDHHPDRVAGTTACDGPTRGEILCPAAFTGRLMFRAHPGFALSPTPRSPGEWWYSGRGRTSGNWRPVNPADSGPGFPGPPVGTQTVAGLAPSDDHRNSVVASTSSARPVYTVRTRFAAAASGPRSPAILPGLVLGDTATVTATTIAAFRTAGLTHLTAVSGANVTIVCGAVLLTAGLDRAAASYRHAGSIGTGAVRVRGATHRQRAARRGDGRHRADGRTVGPPPSGHPLAPRPP